MTENEKISELVTSYIETNNLSNRRLAQEINDQLGIDAITYGAVRYWRVGETKPLPALIEILYQRADEPTKGFALDLLKVLKPDEYDNGRQNSANEL